MRKKEWLICVALMVAVAARPGVAEAQLSDTGAFLADLANQYRVIPNVVYHTANNHENKLDLYLPTNASGPVPVLLMIHGGGWREGSWRDFEGLAPQLSRKGLMVASMDYRLAPEHPWPAQREDVLEALAFLDDPSRDGRSLLLFAGGRRDHLGAHLVRDEAEVRGHDSGRVEVDDLVDGRHDAVLH